MPACPAPVGRGGRLAHALACPKTRSRSSAGHDAIVWVAAGEALRVASQADRSRRRAIGMSRTSRRALAAPLGPLRYQSIRARSASSTSRRASPAPALELRRDPAANPGPRRAATRLSARHGRRERSSRLLVAPVGASSCRPAGGGLRRAAAGLGDKPLGRPGGQVQPLLEPAQRLGGQFGLTATHRTGPRARRPRTSPRSGGRRPARVGA